MSEVSADKLMDKVMSRIMEMSKEMQSNNPAAEIDSTEVKENICDQGLDLAPKNNATENKPRPTLLPLDIFIQYAIPAYEEGILKYVRESWRKGFKTSVMVDAMLRHISKFYWDGENWDLDAAINTGIKKHHLGAVIFCCCSILNCFDLRPELDDRPNGIDEYNEKRTNAEIEAFIANKMFKDKG